jgi:DNA-binding CsgD family transcriptional regulator
VRERGLTRREIEVLLVAEQGKTNAEIAAALFASSAAVRQHLQSIFAKLRVSNRTAAVMRLRPQPLDDAAYAAADPPPDAAQYRKNGATRMATISASRGSTARRSSVEGERVERPAPTSFASRAASSQEARACMEASVGRAGR